LYLYWETHDVVDDPGRWAMTVGLINTAPKDVSTVDITPRHVQAFRAHPGARLRWINTSLHNKQVVQSGEVVVDRWGLVTLPNVIVGKGKNRLTLTP
jgi:hypothetical protein